MAQNFMSPWLYAEQEKFNPQDLLLAQNELPLEPAYAAPQLPPVTSMSQKSSSVRQSTAPRPQTDWLAEQLNAKGLDSLKQQSEGISQLAGQQGFIDAIPRQMDLSPWANLISQWSGKDFVSNYEKPLSPNDRTKMTMGLQGNIQKARENLSEREVDLLRSQLGIATAREAREDRMDAKKDELSLRRELADKRTEGKGSVGQDAVDRNFAKVYTDYVAAGGSAASSKALNQISEVRQKLANLPGATGPAVGRLPFKEVFAPQTQAIQDAIEEVVQGNLRATLGSQFTQEEAARLIARSFNPSLSVEENLSRLDRLKLQMQKAAEAKEGAIRHFEERGSLQGFKGKIFTSADEFDLGDSEKKLSREEKLKLLRGK